MKFKEFFTGTREEKNASAAVKKLQRKAKLRKRDLENIQRFKKIACRRFIRLALSTLLSLGVAGGVLASQSDGGKKEAPAPVSKKTRPSYEPLPTIPPPRPTNRRYPTVSPAQQRVNFDKGFEIIMGDIPHRTDDPNLKQLSEIRQFRDTMVMWVGLRGNAYYALENGHRGMAGLAVVPPGHDLAKGEPNMVELDPSPENNILKIQPQKITPEWAGILLVHELSHLQDRAYDLEPRQPTREEWLGGEVDAYMIEVKAIDHFTQGAFEKAVKEQIKRFNLTVDKVFTMPHSHQKGEWGKIMASLNATITSKPSLGPGEEGARCTLFQLAICFEIIDSQNLDPKEAYAAKMDVEERSLKENDGGWRVPKR